MKKLIISLVVVALAHSGLAQSPIYAPQLLYGGTSNALANATTTVGAVISCQKQSKVGVSITSALDAASTGVLTYNYAHSVDGVKYETTNATIVIASNGTNVITVQTNLDTLGGGYIKLVSIANTNATANATNFNITYGVKISAP